MKIEIWSDVVCPFCYIGKRNLENALSRFVYADDIIVEWKSFQLDAYSPEVVNDTYVGYVAKKRGVNEEQGLEMLGAVVESAKTVGLEYNFDKAVLTNSTKAHLLIQFAKENGKGNEIEEELFKAFFTDGKNISDINVLLDLGKNIGLDEQELPKAFSDPQYDQWLSKDKSEARQVGVSGVPYFIIDRKYAVSGAQPADLFLRGITQAHKEWSENQTIKPLKVTEGDSCSIDGKCD